MRFAGEAPRQGAAAGRRVAVLGIALCMGALALVGVACSRTARTQPAPAFPLPLIGQVNLSLGAQGLSVLPRGQAPAWAPGLVASQAPRAAALGASPQGYLLAALNRFGLGRIEASPDRRALKLVNLPRMELAGRSVAALWPWKEGFLLELYRDPFETQGQPRNDQEPELLGIGPAGETRVLGRLGLAGEDLFALFPTAQGTWLAELRQEKALGARLRYATFATVESSKDGTPPPGKDLARDLFEASLAPRPLTAAPAALRAAVEALGTGPYLVRALGASGQDGYWISSGRGDEAAEAWAWIGPGESAALVVDREGGLAWARASGKAASGRLALPVQGAVYGPCAALFPEGEGQAGIAAAAWSQGSFPLVSSSGLGLVALPSLP